MLSLYTVVMNALQVIRTSFLSPRPRLFPPPWFRPRVVRTLDNTIHCINHYPADKYYRETNYIIHWMGIYLVDSVIQLLSSRVQCVAKGAQ